MLNAEALKSLCSPKKTSACTCPLRPCAGWESFTEDRWPQAYMQAVGSLRDPDAYPPTTQEHHPNSTRYGSADAPIAVNFFPYNLCDVFACGQCDKQVLRYTEFGGYYVDHRVRELNADLVV